MCLAMPTTPEGRAREPSQRKREREAAGPPSGGSGATCTMQSEQRGVIYWFPSASPTPADAAPGRLSRFSSPSETPLCTQRLSPREQAACGAGSGERATPRLRPQPPRPRLSRSAASSGRRLGWRAGSPRSLGSDRSRRAGSGPASCRRRRLRPPPSQRLPSLCCRRPRGSSGTWRAAPAASGRRWPPTRRRSCTTRTRTARRRPSGTWRWTVPRRVLGS